MPALMLRSLVLVPWLVILLARGERHAGTAGLALALVALWTVALLRDRRGRSTGLEITHPGIRPS